MRLSAIMLLFKEQAFVEASVRAIYPVVDSICCISQHDRNLVGKPLAPDKSVEVLLKVPDPENKIRLVVQRDIGARSGEDGEAKLRNVAMRLDPTADYYLIVDSDEIWPLEVLRKSWDYVRQTRASAYRGNCDIYFRKWNYRVVRSIPGYENIVFLRRGFEFKAHRVIDWRTPARWKEYLRTGRKPKTLILPKDWKHYHGSCVGDDQRMEDKLKNYSQAHHVTPGWIEKVWKKFSPDMKDFYYFENVAHEFASVEVVPNRDLPEEITRSAWPEGWIEKDAN